MLVKYEINNFFYIISIRELRKKARTIVFLCQRIKNVFFMNNPYSICLYILFNREVILLFQITWVIYISLSRGS